MSFNTISGPLMGAVRYSPTGAISDLNYSTPSWSRAISRTDTVRRHKPVDMFAAGTAVSHSRELQASTWGVRKYSDGSKDLAPGKFWNAAGVPAGGRLDMDTSILDARLRAKIKDQKLNIAQDLYEYRQASSMFLGAARDVIAAFHSVRSGRAIGDFVRILKRPAAKHELSIANRWLEYQYGLKPLIQDIYGLTDVIVTKLSAGIYCYVRSSATCSKTTLVTTTTPGMGTTTYEECKIRGTARYKLQSTALKQLAQMGITNPASLLWEIIPYSFVIDWMFPVGKFLESLDALNGTSDLKVIRSQTRVLRSVATAYGGSHEYTYYDYTRQGVSGVLSLPKLRYEPSKSLMAVANGLALLTQLRARAPRGPSMRPQPKGKKLFNWDDVSFNRPIYHPRG